MNRGALSLVASQFVSAASKLAVFILISQTGGIGAAGSYSLALAVVSPIFLLLGLSLRQIYVTHDGVVYSEYLRIRLFSGFIGIAFAWCLAALLFADHAFLVLALASYRFIELLVDMRIASFQRAHALPRMATATSVFAVLTSIALCATYLITMNLEVSVFMAAVIGSFVFAGACVVRPREALFTRRVSGWSSTLSIVRRGLLLSFSAFLVSLGTSSPIYMLQYFQTPDHVGLYSAIYNVSTIGNILYGSITQAHLKEFADYLRASDYSRFRKAGARAVTYMTVVGVCITVGLHFLGVPAFSAVFGYDFADYYAAIMIMGVTICLSPLGFILDAQLTALRVFSSQTLISLSSLVLTVVSGVLLVWNWSVLGATVAMLVTMIYRNSVKYAIFAKLVR